MSSVSYFCILNFSGMSSYLPISADSPEVSLHQQYEHSAADKGITIKIDCVAHGNPSPQVCDTLAELETIEKEFRSIKVFWTFQCYTVNLIQFHNKKSLNTQKYKIYIFENQQKQVESACLDLWPRNKNVKVEMAPRHIGSLPSNTWVSIQLIYDIPLG